MSRRTRTVPRALRARLRRLAQSDDPAVRARAEQLLQALPPPSWAELAEREAELLEAAERKGTTH